MLQKTNHWIFLLAILLSLTACNFSASSSEADSSWAFNNFIKLDSVNPILTPDSTSSFFCPIQNSNTKWESKNVLNPTALVKDGKVYLIYRAQDSAMTSRLGLAISEDGIHFKKTGQPIFYPAKDSFYKYEWKGGVEDPRIVSMPGGGYFLTYTSYDGKTARLCFATSLDLMHWEKEALF